MDTTRLKDFFTGLQGRIVAELEAFDGQPFRTDSWERPEGGGGISRLIEEGDFFERGGVNFSHVTGKSLPASATAVRPQLAGRAWEAMGVSLVLHPRNPYCPTAHMNVRCFVASKEGEEDVWWFGGGMDMTPYYGQREDVAHFHHTCKDALAPFGDEVYPKYKKWCDEYFFLKHRNEPRGVGGIFFDDLNEGGFERCFDLTQAVGNAFTAGLPAGAGQAPRHALRRARARLPGLPPRPLRRIQPGLGPRHAVRPAIGRAHRIDPDVAAADRQMALRLEAGTPARRKPNCTRSSCSRRLGLNFDAGALLPADPDQGVSSRTLPGNGGWPRRSARAGRTGRPARDARRAFPRPPATPRDSSAPCPTGADSCTCAQAPATAPLRPDTGAASPRPGRCERSVPAAVSPPYSATSSGCQPASE